MSYHVLIVDDDPAICKLLSKVMISNEMDPLVVNSGAAALDLIARQSSTLDMILMDITLGDMEGFDVIQTIRRVADDLVMYDRGGAIINRVTDPAMIPYIHIEGTELLACIGSDSLHAANDIRGLSVFDLPADAPVLAGAREALTKLAIL